MAVIAKESRNSGKLMYSFFEKFFLGIFGSYSPE
jgi:hypothetical protein